jgi:hypothetical protein
VNTAASWPATCRPTFVHEETFHVHENHDVPDLRVASLLGPFARVGSTATITVAPGDLLDASRAAAVLAFLQCWIVDAAAVGDYSASNALALDLQ